MALKSYQQVKTGGTALAFTTAGAVGVGIGFGDTVAAADDGALLVWNASGGAITATVLTPGSTKYGQAIPDVTSVSIPATSIAAIGPFPADLRDPSDNLVHINYSAITSVSVAAVRI
jgi:hypothetical protein